MTEYLFRRNTVIETLRGSRRQLLKLWVQKGLDLPPSISVLIERKKLPVQEADKGLLYQLAGDKSHQGLVLEVGPYQYGSLEAVLATAASRNEQPFLLLLDLLHGPQNIGSLIRTAEACGVHGVIMQDRRAPEITPQVVIHSAGSTEHILIAKVTNLIRTMEELKQLDIWLVGLDIDKRAQRLGDVDLNMALGLVVGHEGRGLRRLVRDHCDILLRLPMRGQIESLNAAAAGAIALYAAWQARGFQA